MQGRYYFKGLNGLRFFAAALVVIWHSNWIINPTNNWTHPFWHFLSQNGSHAVSFFFVLSGFLISYLLLAELKETHTIRIKGFYLKRIFRIWPIYYLLIIICQVILPLVFHALGQPFLTLTSLSTFFYLIILPNVPMLFQMGVGKIGHLWSIGVEEQFYLFWPWLIKYFKPRFIQISIALVGIKLCFYLFTKDMQFNHHFWKWTTALVNSFAVENMAIGGLGAYWVLNYKKQLMQLKIFEFKFQLAILSLLLIYLSIGDKMIPWPHVRTIFHALFSKDLLGFVVVPMLYLYLILNTSLNEKSIINTENKILNYLGNISYGLYIYHMLAIYAIEMLLRKLYFHPGSPVFAFVFLFLVFILNIAIASFSYKYIESKLLRFRPSNETKPKNLAISSS